MPDLALTFGCTIDPRRPLHPGDDLMVLAYVQVRSDKLALDANDAETHTFGGKVLSAHAVAHDHEAFHQLAEHLAHLAKPNGDQLDIYDIDLTDPPPANGDLPEPLATIEGDGIDPIRGLAEIHPKVPVDATLAELRALELTPGRFYAAAKALRDGATIDQVTQGWTSPQRDYLAGFLPKPRQRTRKNDIPPVGRP